MWVSRCRSGSQSWGGFCRNPQPQSRKVAFCHLLPWGLRQETKVKHTPGHQQGGGKGTVAGRGHQPCPSRSPSHFCFAPETKDPLLQSVTHHLSAPSPSFFAPPGTLKLDPASVSPLPARGMLPCQQVPLRFPASLVSLTGSGSQARDGGGPRPAPCSLVSILPLP